VQRRLAKVQRRLAKVQRPQSSLHQDITLMNE
jgi:hypothetical protein